MTKQICDFCGKETDYFKCNLPVNAEPTDHIPFWHGHPVPYKFKSYDVCEKCMIKLIKTIEDLKGVQ